MKYLPTKTITLATILLAVSVFIVQTSAINSVYAASSGATKFCKTFKNKDEAKACEYGYDHGDATGQAYAKLCSKYSTSALRGACDNGKIAGAAAPTRINPNGSTHQQNAPAPPAHDTCGSGENAVKTSIDIGCVQKGNAVLDATFAIVRFLSNGVGLVLIGSLVYAGIQFSLSRSNPQANAAAQNRIKSVILALFIYIFAYALLNYLVPGKLLR